VYSTGILYGKISAMNYEEIKVGALGLNLKERAALAKELLDSVNSPIEEELEDDEVGKRLERAQRRESQLNSLEETLKRAKSVMSRNITK
jgi:hypothetical protein